MTEETVKQLTGLMYSIYRVALDAQNKLQAMEHILQHEHPGVYSAYTDTLERVCKSQASADGMLVVTFEGLRTKLLQE